MSPAEQYFYNLARMFYNSNEEFLSVPNSPVPNLQDTSGGATVISNNSFGFLVPATVDNTIRTPLQSNNQDASSTVGTSHLTGCSTNYYPTTPAQSMTTTSILRTDRNYEQKMQQWEQTERNIIREKRSQQYIYGFTRLNSRTDTISSAAILIPETQLNPTSVHAASPSERTSTQSTRQPTPSPFFRQVTAKPKISKPDSRV